MKRIAALAATMIGLLAIPTAAMASTVGSGESGSGDGTVVSVQPDACYYGFHKVDHHVRKYFYWWQNGRVFTTSYCPFPEQIPLPPPNQCEGPTLTFSVAANSSTLTEVSGPQLYPTEQFVYDGDIYTIMSVNPGADQFTAFVHNLLFTNDSGAAITNAVGVIVSCSS